MEKNSTNKKNSKKKKRPAEYSIFNIIAKFNSFFNQGNLIDISVC